MEFTRQHGPKKGNCFIIMPYGKKTLPDGREFDWERHYKEVVERAINGIPMTPIRAGTIYGPALIDSVWKGIQEAEVVIADLTGQNPNVLYELGLAHVIGKRVVLLAQQEENIPADIAYTRQIRYSVDDPVDVLHFMDELKENVRAARDEQRNVASTFPT